MSDHPVFRTGFVKQALGWLVFVGGGVALAALIWATVVNLETQTPADLGSGVVIGLFIAGLMLCGIAIQSQRWSVEGDAVVLHHFFRRKTIPIATLGGFGKLTVIVGLFPLAHLELYDRELKPVVRLPVTHKDMPQAEALLASRLRYVINEGSLALPRRRFAD